MSGAAGEVRGAPGHRARDAEGRRRLLAHGLLRRWAAVSLNEMSGRFCSPPWGGAPGAPRALYHATLPPTRLLCEDRCRRLGPRRGTEKGTTANSEGR